ncbi:MAG: hypothetical protein SH847_11740 [Roseiflexaceae bacterium]|nr:hypothetical protein [Roseiflexaceae bacterium]
MTPTTHTLDVVLRLVQQLSLADKARLVAHVTPQIASALASQAVPEPVQHADDVVALLPPDSPAGKLVRDPTSALAQVLALLPEGFIPPTDEDIARWRDERLTERYGA